MSKITALICLLALALVQVGCATEEQTSLETGAPASTHDDSHGWGANIGSAGGR